MSRNVLMMAVCVFVASPAARAAEPELVATENVAPARFEGRSRLVDPDASVFGVPFGATEAEVVEAFGPPTGIYLLSEAKKLLFYGVDVGLIFRKGRLAECILASHGLIDWNLMKQVEKHPFFDARRWQLSGGLSAGASFDDVAKRLGKDLGEPRNSASYTTAHAAVDLQFYSRTEKKGEKPSSFGLATVIIRNLSWASADAEPNAK